MFSNFFIFYPSGVILTNRLLYLYKGIKYWYFLGEKTTDGSNLNSMTTEESLLHLLLESFSPTDSETWTLSISIPHSY